MPLLKGSAWLINLDFVREKYGPEALDKVLKAMQPEDRDVLSKPILAASWGPDFTVFMRFILKADKVLGRGDMSLLPEAAANHFKRDTKFYSMLMGFFSAETLLKNVPVLWKTYLKPPGEPKTFEISPKHWNIQLRNFENMPLYHDRYHTQYAVSIGVVAKCKNYQVRHVLCTARGDQECLWDVTWE
jgi:hypothetical protein